MTSRSLNGTRFDGDGRGLAACSAQAPMSGAPAGTRRGEGGTGDRAGGDGPGRPLAGGPDPEQVAAGRTIEEKFGVKAVSVRPVAAAR